MIEIFAVALGLFDFSLNAVFLSKLNKVRLSLVL